MTTESQPSHSGSALTTLLVCASLGLNVFLAAKLLHRKPSLPPQSAPAMSALGEAKRPAAPLLTLAATEAAGVA
jgi:hypothetical protein